MSLNKLTIQGYLGSLREYAVAYKEFASGMRKDGGSYKTYNKLAAEVVRMAAYIRMLEDMYPSLIEHKPKSYTAIYRPIKRTNYY